MPRSGTPLAPSACASLSGPWASGSLGLAPATLAPPTSARPPPSPVRPRRGWSPVPATGVGIWQTYQPDRQQSSPRRGCSAPCSATRASSVRRRGPNHPGGALPAQPHRPVDGAAAEVLPAPLQPSTSPARPARQRHPRRQPVRPDAHDRAAGGHRPRRRRRRPRQLRHGRGGRRPPACSRASRPWPCPTSSYEATTTPTARPTPPCSTGSPRSPTSCCSRTEPATTPRSPCTACGSLASTTRAGSATPAPGHRQAGAGPEGVRRRPTPGGPPADLLVGHEPWAVEGLAGGVLSTATCTRPTSRATGSRPARSPAAARSPTSSPTSGGEELVGQPSAFDVLTFGQTAGSPR